MAPLHKAFSTLVLALLLLAGGLPVAAPAAELCGGLANCTNGGGMRNCTRMLTLGFSSILAATTTASAPPVTGCAVTIAMMTAPAMATFTAMQPTTAVAGTCGFTLMVFTASTVTHSCTIDASDGLPVELMDFSIVQPET